MMIDPIEREDAIRVIKALECFGYIECKTKALVKDINAIPSADRPSESIGKLIERMEEYRDKQLLMSDYWYGINWAINTIRVSDIVDRPQGEWIPATWQDEHCPERLKRHKCSECGQRAKQILVKMELVDNYYCNKAEPSTEYTHEEQLSKFCPNCGARMKGADDESS